MPTSNEKFATSGSRGNHGGSGGEPTVSERHEHEGRTPQPGVPAGPRDTQYPSNSGYEYPEKTYEKTGRTPPPGRTAQETKEIRAREGAKRRRKRRRSRERVSSIEDKLNFAREQRAKSYETDKFAEISAKYFERNPDGTIKTKKIDVPVIKTSEDKIKQDERKYRKIIRAQALSGASKQSIKLLNKAAAQKVIEDNYVVGKHGHIATEQHTVPVIKPGRRQDFNHELSEVKHDVHEIREGNKSYYFQSRVSKAQEEALQQKLDEQNNDGGILGGIPVVGGAVSAVANDPVGALYHVVAPVPSLIASKAGVNFTEADEKVLSGASKGISELAKTLGKNPNQEMQDAYLEQSGIPVLSDVPRLRQGVVHGLHTGIVTGAEYLTRPGLVIEQGIGQGIGAGGNPWEAVLHGHKGKGVIFGKDIAEKLTGKPQGGLLIDFATDPTLWVGAGEVKLVTGERLASLTDRIAKINPALLEDSVTSKLLKDASERGDPEVVLSHLEDLAESHGISLKRLGKTKADREAIQGWKDRIAKKQEARVGRDAKARAENKYFMGGKSRREAVEEAGRVAKEQKSEAGLRIKFQTPLGKEISSIDIKLPKKFADAHKVIPDLHLSPTMRKENYKELLNLRRSTIDKEVMKAYDAEIADATKALKDATTPEARRAAEERMTNLRRKLDEARSEAKASIDTSKLRSPAEHAAQRSSRRLAHELNRVASANARSVFHRAFANMEDAMKGLSEKERQQVGLHMAEYADTGGRDTAEAIAPLNDKQRVALENMKSVNYELGRYGLETGTIDQLTKDYAFRHVVKGANPLGKGAEDTAAEKASTLHAASNPHKSRGYAATAEVTGRGNLATQLQKLSHGTLSREEALKLADNWHERGKVRAIQEDLAHAAQRGHNAKEHELTPLEKEAYEWGRGRQKVNGEKIPDLFKNLEDTEGQIKLTNDAYKTHNFEENPFGSLTEKEALALKHATAQGSLERLRAMRDSVERPNVREDLERIIERREAEVNSYKEIREPKRRASETKINERIAKVEELRNRPGTTGEGAAAQAMLGKLKEKLKGSKSAKADFGDFIPQAASKEYLGSLKDFRDEHPEQFTILDPKLANYHRSLRESIKSAYTLRWKAVDKAFGRASTDERLRTPDGKLFYDKKTGEEYIHADPSVFKGAIPEGRLLPAQLHADLKSEFFRMGENVAHDLFDDASAGLFGKLSSMTRFSLTTYFPAYHLRNMISDTMNSLLADPGVLFHPIVNGKLAESAMTAGKGFAKTIKVPGFEQAIKTEDYLFMMETLGLKSQEHLAEFIAAAEKGQLADKPWWRKAGLGRSSKTGEFALRMSARREDIIRMQTMLQRMRRNGGDAAEAAWHTIKYHFDYADLSQWEKRYMRNAFLFYTWYRKNIPLQFLSMIQKPGFFSALTNTYIELAEGGTPFNFNWNKINPLLPDLSGPVPNSSLIPDYMTRLMASPVVNWNGHAVALSMGLPWSDMNLVTSALENPEEGIRSFFNMLIPPARLGAELGFGQSLLTGQKLEGYENSTWSNLLSTMGAKLPTDDEGRPLLPWQVGVIMNNVFPAVGRGAGYLKPPSSVEDQGTFSTLFGGGAGTALTGISAYVGPKEGERLDKAYIYKVYERAAQREAVMESGKANKQRDEDLEKFDKQTEEWAKANGVPEKYLHVVQGLGPKWFISKSDRKVASETGLLDTEEGGLESSVGTKGLFSTGSEAGTLGTESYEPPAKKYKSRTEEALDLLGPTKTGGFSGLAAKPVPDEAAVEASLQSLKANKKLEWKLAGQGGGLGKTRSAQSYKLPGLKTPKTKGKGQPADVQKAQASVGNFLGKNKLGKGPKAKEHEPPKKVKVAAISGLPDDPSTRFAEALAYYSGMSPQVAGAWTLSEMGGEASGGGAGKYNYLGVGFPGEKTALSEEVPTSSPEAAARFTAEWLNGKYSGPHPSVTGIQEILPKSNGGKNLQKFAAALGESGWGTDPSHVLENAASVTVNGKTELQPGGKDFKLVTSRQQARTVIHLANKFAGTQEGSALQQHWAAMSGISGSEPWCSAFLATLMRRVGLPEPSSPAAAGTWESWKGGKLLDTTDLAAAKPGDIIEFGTSRGSNYADHVGLYIGDGEMISGNFGNEVRRGPISEESSPIQAIVRPHYSGKEIQFKLSTNPTALGTGAASGAVGASGGPSSGAVSGPAAQSTPGYHPGRTKQAQIEAARMRQNITSGIGKSSSIKSLLSQSEAEGLGPDSAYLFKLATKVKAEIEQDTARNSSLTARTKRKPKFKLVK